MRARIDRAAVLAGVDIVDVVSRYVELKREGREYKGPCPFHDEKTPSFHVIPDRQFYYCFGCGKHGDAISFLMDHEDLQFPEAARRLNAGALPEPDPSRPAPEPIPANDDKPDWEPVLPVPEHAPPLMEGERTCRIYNPKRAGTDREWTSFKPVMVHTYRGSAGEILGYVLRVEFPGDNGKRVKITPQVTWCRHRETGEERWAMVNLPEPRPLYGLDQLAAKPKAPVFIPEGEKCADLAAEILPALASVCWPGGGKALNKVDWSALAGRNIIIMRDADKPGYVTAYGAENEAGELVMRGLVHYLREAGANAIRVVEPPDNVESGWDIWDAVKSDGWTATEVAAWVKTHAQEPLPPQRPEQKPEQPEPVDSDNDDAIYEAEAAIHSADADEKPDFVSNPEDEGSEPIEPRSTSILRPDDPVRALGYDHGTYFYLAKSARQVITLTASQHSKLGLLSMADLDWWQNRYPKDSDAGTVAWDMAANAVIRACEDVGVFDPERLRGRGAWWDEGKSVLHLGDHLVVDGQRVELAEKDGWYIYEAGAPMRVDIDNPLTPREAIRLLEICKNMQWEKPIDAYLLAGWIFLAPICGALNWRPHIWLTAPAGTGKSWTITNVVGRATGRFALKPLSSTTEPAIRQRLGHDARPVIFDEAEGEDQQAQQRLQSIMQLVRQASSESDGEIMKGSSGGRAMSFRARSMFAFASIGVSAHQYADKTRITVLQMKPDPTKTPEQRDEQFRRLERLTFDTLTDEYVERLNARAVRMIGVIRANARTFARAGARVIGQQRVGDQIGALLAGTYALHSNNVISLEDAQAWIERQDWSDELTMVEQRDEMSCLQRIMEHVIRVTTTLGATVDRSIGELVRITAFGNKAGATENIDQGVASETLKRHGILIEPTAKTFVVSNTHTALAKILRDSPWPTNWGRILKRLPNAEASGPHYFTGGASRGVELPVETIFS